MWSIAKDLPVIKGQPSVKEKRLTNPLDSESGDATTIYLEHPVINLLAQDLLSVGLVTTPGEALALIIPPLSATKKLPQPEPLLETRTERARDFQHNGEWAYAREQYLDLLQVTKYEQLVRAGIQDEVAVKSLALLMNFRSEFREVTENREENSTEFKEVDKEFESLWRLGDVVLRKAMTALVETPGRLGERPYEFDVLVHQSNKKENAKSGKKKKDAIERNRTMLRSFFGSKIYYPDDFRDKEFPSDFDTETLKKVDVLGRTLLHYAASRSTKVAALFRSNAYNADDVRAADIFGWTPLHYAAWNDNRKFGTELLKFMVRTGGIDETTGDGMSPLHCAVAKGHKEFVDLLIAKGAKVDGKDLYDRTILHYTARKGHKGILEQLLKYKRLDQFAKDVHGRTALHVAAEGGRLDAVKVLLETGDYSIKDRDGRNAVHLAAAQGHDKVTREILIRARDKGVVVELVDATDKQGRRPLHVAAHNGKLEIVKLLLDFKLLDYDVGTSWVDDEAKTPLYLASDKDHIDVIKYLLKHMSQPAQQLQVEGVEAETGERERLLTKEMHVAIESGAYNLLNLI